MRAELSPLLATTRERPQLGPESLGLPAHLARTAVVTLDVAPSDCAASAGFRGKVSTSCSQPITLAAQRLDLSTTARAVAGRPPRTNRLRPGVQGRR
jgi:hypothetical protein